MAVIMKKLYLFSNKIFLLVLCTLLLPSLFYGCVSPANNKDKLNFDQLGTPQYYLFPFGKVPNRMYKNIPLANTGEIKLFIYAHEIQKEIDYAGVDYLNGEYRLIWEPDFDYIAEVLREKYPGIKLVHGRRSCAAPKEGNPNDGTRKVEDGLDYSVPYVYKYGVVLLQLGEMRLSDDGQEIQIYFTRYRSGMDGSGSVYCFKKKGENWFFFSDKSLWMS